MSKIDVIDIYQGNVIHSWPKVKAQGIQGVIHKATEGGGFRDKLYGARRAQVASVGLLWGAYHFANATPVATQAANFLGHAAPDASTLLALDWEDSGHYGRMSAPQAREWLKRVCDATKRDPSGVWIYGGHVLREEIRTASDLEFFSQFPLWLCHYGVKTPWVPAAWKSKGYDLWQYSDQYMLPDGASGSKIDFNVVGKRPLREIWAPGTKPVPVAEYPSEPAPAPAPAPDKAKVTEPAPTTSAWDVVKGWFKRG
jgi:lysozyme